MLKGEEVDDVEEQRVIGISEAEGLAEGVGCLSELKRSRQTNRTSPVSRGKMVNNCMGRLASLD
jgi:hypothetical protein